MSIGARLLTGLALSSLLATGADGFQGKTPAQDPMQASAWEIGPVINGRNYSVGMPLQPSPHPDGWFFEFPQPSQAAGHVNYVTFNHGSLSAKKQIILRYRIEASPDVQIVPRDYPHLASTLTLYFQRRGDNWSGTGAYETYRWWSTFRVHAPLTPGDHVLAASLDENWTAIDTSSAASNPKEFRNAVRHAERVGFTFGGGAGWGKGVYATGPARFIVTGFEVR
jgi:hypothetical protein